MDIAEIMQDLFSHHRIMACIIIIARIARVTSCDRRQATFHHCHQTSPAEPFAVWRPLADGEKQRPRGQGVAGEKYDRYRGTLKVEVC